MHRKIENWVVVYLVSAFAGMFSMGSHADALLDEIKARSVKIKEYKELLSNPDQVTRLAALDVMLKSDDTVMKNTAFTVAFSSDDEQIKSLALKHRLAYLNNIPLEVTNGEEVKTILLNIRDYDFNTGRFQSLLRIKSSSLTGAASVYGTTVRGDGYFGTYVLRLVEGAKLVGHIETNEGRFPATAELM